jgi:putative transposase
LEVVLALVAYAAARLTSLADACDRLRDAPDADTVLGHLARQGGDTATLDRRLRRLLAASLPRAVRRGTWDLGIDLTLVPYHGEPFADPSEIYRSQPKHGTTHFHAYATAFLLHDGHRFTLAVLAVAAHTPMHTVVRDLCRRVRAAGVTVRRLLLDRGFNNAGVIRYLHAARQPFVMPQAIHGQAPRSGILRGLRALRATHPTGWTTYAWQPDDGRRVRVDLCIVRRRRRDRHGHRAFVYACWGIRATPQTVYQLYRRRFGIETSYRQLHQGRVRTTSRNPVLRFFFVAVALLLRNLWVWLHWVVLAVRRRGGRQLQPARLRLRTLLLWLQHRAERAFRWCDWTEDTHPLDEALVTKRLLRA